MSDIEPIKPFFGVNSAENGIMTRPMCGDSSKVQEVHEWLEERAIRSHLDFPRIYWWLKGEDLLEFINLYGEYKFPN